MSKDGKLQAIAFDDLTGIGPYSVYPRTSAGEGNQVVNLVGGPYVLPHYRGRTTVVFQNKTPTCQYRAVGHPIATAVAEGLVDLCAEAIGMDPAEIRRRNLIPDDAYLTATTPTWRLRGCRTRNRSPCCSRRWSTTGCGRNRRSCAPRASIAASGLPVSSS